MLSEPLQWLAFSLFALLTVLGALGMTTTMSMFRSGIFLMASFIGVAGLFILLSADLLGLLQIMMYIGGMLVMILFMLLFSMDPGGAMMAGMKMSPIERLFSRGLRPAEDGGEDGAGHPDAHGGHEVASVDHGQMGGGMDMDQGRQGAAHAQMDHAGMDHGDMDMGAMDMSMVTPARPWAAWLGLAVTSVLVGLLLWRPAWPLSSAVPHPDSARQIGTLLMGKYMMAFEGAGLLILLGIFGAVFLQRPGSHPSPQGREAYVTADKNPVPISTDEA